MNNLHLLFLKGAFALALLAGVAAGANAVSRASVVSISQELNPSAVAMVPSDFEDTEWLKECRSEGRCE